MSNLGKTHIVIMWTVGADDVAEWDRIFASHGEWMKGTPARAMRHSSLTPSPRARSCRTRWTKSEPTGKMIFVLDEYYESLAGVARHWQDAMQNWQDLGAVLASSEKATVATLHSGTVVQGLW